jgi:hypothetical protein
MKYLYETTETKGEYVIYSPATESFMHSTTLFELRWEENYDRASHLTEENVDMLLDACHELYESGMRSEENWFEFTAGGLIDMWLDGDIVNLEEFMLIPKILITKWFDKATSRVCRPRLRVDFTKAEPLFVGFTW